MSYRLLIIAKVRGQEGLTSQVVEFDSRRALEEIKRSLDTTPSFGNGDIFYITTYLGEKNGI